MGCIKVSRAAIRGLHTVFMHVQVHNGAPEPERRQQLELLEDKLREFRTLGPTQHDDKVAR